ncbi:unnamed protein product [Caenorhabditis nigoni]
MKRRSMAAKRKLEAIQEKTESPDDSEDAPTKRLEIHSPTPETSSQSSPNHPGPFFEDPEEASPQEEEEEEEVPDRKFNVPDRKFGQICASVISLVKNYDAIVVGAWKFLQTIFWIRPHRNFAFSA